MITNDPKNKNNQQKPSTQKTLETDNNLSNALINKEASYFGLNSPTLHTKAQVSGPSAHNSHTHGCGCPKGVTGFYGK